MLLPLAGCPSRKNDFADAASLAGVQSPLAWTVNRAQATHRLPTSSLENHEPAPGNQFVVLDVSVRNRDVGPQVLSEGKLIAMDESNLQTFDTPVTVLSDDYLSLQVLQPAQSMRGKIAYEVPEHLSGVLFWSPGNGSERILLNLATPPAMQRTLAQAEDEDASVAVTPSIDASTDSSIDTTELQDSASAPRTETAHDVPDVPKAASTPERPAQRVARSSAAKPDDSSKHADSAKQAIAKVAPKPSAPPSIALPPNADVALPEDNQPAAPAPAQTRLPVRAVATLDAPRPALVIPPALANSRMTASRPTIDREQARRDTCAGLVSRDDPSEKAASLGFFAQSCRDFGLPPSWRPPVARRSLLARASDLLARMVVKPHVVRVPDCSSSASAADRLVCADPALSAMDQQLAQSVARASANVDDPAALQRAQAQWRGRVRNSCDTRNCLQRAYGHRIAQLDALTPMRP